MRQPSQNKRLDAPPDGNDPPVSGALSNSSHISDNQPVSDYSLVELQRNLRESELLRQIAILANEAATSDDAIQMCLDEVCTYTGWPVGHAYVPATDGELNTTKLWHIDDPERFENYRRVTETTRYTSDQGLPSRVMAEAAPQWMVSDTTYQHMPRANARIEAGLKSGFAFPAMAGETVVAVLEFFSPEVIEPDPQFLSVTDEIGILIGQVIERKQAEQALSDSDTRYRQLAELSPDGMYVHVDGEIVFANASLARILAVPSPEDLLGKQAIDLPAPEHRAHILGIRAKVMEGGVSELEQSEFLRFDGSRVPVERTATLVSWNNTPAILILVRDISERDAAAKVLRSKEQHISSILTNIADAVVTIDDRGLIETFNSAAENMFGYATDEVKGQNVSMLMPEPDRSAHDGYVASYQTTGRGKVIGVGAREVMALHKQGQTFPIELTVSEVTLDDGHVFIGAMRDITERKQAEGALRDSEERFRQMAENISEVFWMTDPMKSEMIYISPAYERIWGRTRQSLYETPLSFVEAIHPEDRERVVEAFKKQFRGEYDEEYRIVRPDGMVRQIRDRAFPIKNKQDEVYRVVGIAEDITEEKRRDEQLAQGQKMKAVGQLTGGIAHDFNNLLAVILGNAELLSDQIGDNRQVSSIDRAATRGAELTQRLLAFSRQQTLAPQSIDLTELVSGLHDLLHRTLGEPVKIVTDVPEEIWPVLADPGQLENALLNLSINARDAMPVGGILQITCSNIELQEGDLRATDEVAAGDYVQIAVRDTGTGIPKDLLEHVFEPFYTTKDVGEGTGLGLSMVYGFARQSGGDAVIESTLGTGTEVKLFLPRSEVTTVSDKPTQKEARNRGQGEVILVLEDDPDVRSLAVAALGGLGYRVLEAADANAAMQVLEEEADNLDLLLSDVVLPGGVSGPEFAAKAKDLYPKMKLVFMSGYADDLYTDDKIPGFDETLLTKPFRLAELAKAIHDTLAA